MYIYIYMFIMFINTDDDDKRELVPINGHKRKYKMFI